MSVIDVVDYLPTHSVKTYNDRLLTDITKLVVHHSATSDGDPWSFARHHIYEHDFPGIGYHSIITRDGRRWKTNYDRTVSYHVGRANDYSIGICLVGDFTYSQPTVKQKFALLRDLFRYGRAYGVQADNVQGHEEAGGYTDCPGDINMEAIRGAYKFLMNY